jgi:hypothetical protein
VTGIDIDGLSEDELVALNARIVERLRFLHQQKTTSALQEIKIGSGVMFEGPDGRVIKGIVVRKNRKTVTVHCTVDERQWNVSPSLLKPSGEDLQTLVEREMPFLKLNDKEFADYIAANVLPFVKK